MYWTIYPRAPFDFKTTLKGIVNSKKYHIAYIDLEKCSYVRAFSIKDLIIPIEITWNFDIDNPVLFIKNLSNITILDDMDKKMITQYVQHIFDTQFDVNLFYLNISDKRLQKVVRNFNGFRVGNDLTIFEASIKAIISQQITMTLAGRFIQEFVELYGCSIIVNYRGEYIKLYVFPTELEVRTSLIETNSLKSLGVRKIDYIKNITTYLLNTSISLGKIDELLLKQLKNELLLIKGIGEWTANYILMFGLGERNYTLASDIGLKKSIQKIYELDERPSNKQVLLMSEEWSPYKTYMTYYLWEYGFSKSLI